MLLHLLELRARGGRADKPQHHDKRCNKMFITVDWSLLGNPCARVRGAVIFSKKGMQPSDLDSHVRETGRETEPGDPARRL